MLHLGLQLVALSLLCRIRNLHTTGHHAASIERLACGIGHSDAVNNKEIIMESFCLRLGSACPHSVGTFRHIVESAKVYLHLLCCGGFHSELHSAVLQNPGILIVADVQRRRLR